MIDIEDIKHLLKEEGEPMSTEKLEEYIGFLVGESDVNKALKA